MQSNSERTSPPLSTVSETDVPMSALETREVLERLAARIGWRRLAIIFRNVALLHGERAEGSQR